MSESSTTTDNLPLATSQDEQPASEWASSTLSALDPANDSSKPTPVPQSVPESPGVNMPGRFPIPKQGVAIPDIQGVASDALKTAAQYAQSAVQSAGESVGEYLPAGVTSYLSSESGTAQQEAIINTIPSQETSQNYYHFSTSGGVGSLPGTPGEIGVAILPDERTGGKSVDKTAHDSAPSTNVTKSSPIMTTTTNNNPIHRRHSDPLERHTGYIPGTLQDDTSLAKLPEERRLENLPSHDDETGGVLGKSGGVGALPGSANESGVALLPDERKEVQEASSGISRGASTDASIRTLLGSSYAPSPLGQVHSLPQTTGREYAFARDEEKVFGDGAKKDLDDPKQGDAKTIPKGATSSNAGQDIHAVGAGSGSLVAGESHMASEDTALPKKSGFIDKVKGEIKILSGKMSHNESKIEEGRKMMGKN